MGRIWEPIDGIFLPTDTVFDNMVRIIGYITSKFLPIYQFFCFMGRKNKNSPIGKDIALKSAFLWGATLLSFDPKPVFTDFHVNTFQLIVWESASYSVYWYCIKFISSTTLSRFYYYSTVYQVIINIHP